MSRALEDALVISDVCLLCCSSRRSGGHLCHLIFLGHLYNKLEGATIAKPSTNGQKEKFQVGMGIRRFPVCSLKSLFLTTVKYVSHGNQT